MAKGLDESESTHLHEWKELSLKEKLELSALCTTYCTLLISTLVPITHDVHFIYEVGRYLYFYCPDTLTCIPPLLVENITEALKFYTALLAILSFGTVLSYKEYMRKAKQVGWLPRDKKTSS